MSSTREERFDNLKNYLIKHIGEDVFNATGSVLEYGCGKTGYADLYRSDTRRAFGVDLHDHKQHWSSKGVEYLQSDGKTIPLGSKSLGLVVSHSVVEHVEDIHSSLSEIYRVLAIGGIGYITVSPLYFSPGGSHIRSLPDWEHLRPESKYYMMTQPIGRQGAYLNKLTISELLAAVGSLPWTIMRMDRKLVPTPIPDWLAGSEISKLDLLTKEFRLVLKRMPFEQKL